MVYYLIICRSLTYAQRTAGVLERSGITARIVRTPKSIAPEGCSHGVKIGERRLGDSLTILAKAGLAPKQIYIMGPNGAHREVAP